MWEGMRIFYQYVFRNEVIPIAKNKTAPFEYDDFKKYSIAEISEMLGIGKNKNQRNVTEQTASCY